MTSCFESENGREREGEREKEEREREWEREGEIPWGNPQPLLLSYAETHYTGEEKGSISRRTPVFSLREGLGLRIMLESGSSRLNMIRRFSSVN